MNIIFLADIVPYPPNTGIKIRTFNILKQLSNNGENKIYLFCFNHKILIPTQALLDEYKIELAKYCVEVHIFDIPSDKNRATYYLALLKNLVQKNPYRVERYYSKQCEDAVKNIVATKKIDLIHFDKTEFCRYLPVVKDIPVCCTNHNVESLLMKRRATFETTVLKKFFANLQYVKTESYEKKMLNKVAAFVTCSEYDRDFFHKELGIKGTSSAVIDNGVDVSFYSDYQCKQPANDYLLLIGAQNKDSTANYDATMYFIKDIWPMVKSRLPDVKLKIVGRNPDASITRLGETEKNIEVVGWVEDEREYIANAAMLLVPLRIGGGSRLKIVTAMAMGKTIVSTSIGAEGISCTHDKDILLGDNADDFAELVCKVYQSDKIRDSIGSEALLLAKNKYDWNKIGEKQRDFYTTLVSNK